MKKKRLEGRRCSPSSVKVGHTPNAETIAAIDELESGGGESFESFDLITKLNAD